MMVHIVDSTEHPRDTMKKTLATKGNTLLFSDESSMLLVKPAPWLGYIWRFKGMSRKRKTSCMNVDALDLFPNVVTQVSSAFGKRDAHSVQ